MRSSFVNETVVRLLPLVPKPLVWRFSRRYIAGTSVAAALAEVGRLNAAGFSATVDVLGEDSRSVAQVERSRDLYLEVLAALEAADLDAGISVKLSELGLRFDQSLCRQVLDELIAKAAAGGRFVRIDMEDSSVTTDTLGVYRWARSRHQPVGAVIQAYLRRSERDVDALLADGIAHVRLCKGIYREAPELAFQDPDQVNDSFRSLLARLFDGDAEHVAIATHDAGLIAHAEEMLAERRVPPERYEFQMLLGVAEGLRERLLAHGHRLRVYVPFGDLWLAYSLRRLKENPQIAGHIISNLLRPR